MFRLFRGGQRGLFSIARKTRVTQPGPEVIRVQRVRFHRRFRVRNFLIAGAAYYFCFSLYGAIFNNYRQRVEDGMEEEGDEDDEGDEVDEDDEGDEWLFLPLPGTTKQIESLPYKGDDPEWLEFIKISKNPALTQSIRGELAEICRRTLEQQLAPRGLGPMTMKRSWINIRYPFGPPPTFVRQGLSFRDLGYGFSIYLAEQDVDSDTHFRINQVLWPSGLVLSLWAFSAALLKQNTNAVASIGNAQQVAGKDQQPLKKTQNAPVSEPPPPPRQGEADGDAPPGTETPMAKASPGTTTTPEALRSGAKVPNTHSPPSKAKEVKDLAVIRATSDHVSGPWISAKRKMREVWRGPPVSAPRGSIYVSGLVEVNSATHWFIVDARAWWDPQTKKFVPRAMSLSLREIRAKNQQPLRR